jgi:hypothetical protein
VTFIIFLPSCRSDKKERSKNLVDRRWNSKISSQINSQGYNKKIYRAFDSHRPPQPLAALPTLLLDSAKLTLILYGLALT